MCEFCLKHGEGEKWYLQAKNYAEDLLADIRRRKFIERFFSHPEDLGKSFEGLRRLEKAPGFIRGMVKRLITRRMKKVHFGQVVPIEEIEKILGFVNSVVRVACICRHVTRGEEKRYCYGFSVSPNGGEMAALLNGLDSGFFKGPDTAGMETLTKEETLAALRRHEQEGLCHTLWTFHTPFIAGMCNCDRSDCLAMRATVSHEIPVMFRAETVAAVDPAACTGCRECMRLCQFGALAYSAGGRKAFIDQRWCYGCGICRSACRQNAIRLEDRSAVPAAARRW